MFRKLSLALGLFALLALALPSLAQPEALTLTTPFSGPRAEFSPDGARLAVYEDAAFAQAMEIAPNPFNTVIVLYDVATGEAAVTLRGAPDFVSGLVFSADGAQVISLLANGTLLTWDAAAGDLLTSAPTLLIGGRTPLFSHPASGALVAAMQNFTHTSYVSIEPASGALTLLTQNVPLNTYGEWRAAQSERRSQVYNDLIAVPAPHSDALAGLPLDGSEVWTVNPQGRVALLSLDSGAQELLRPGSEQPMFDITELVATASGLVAFGVRSEDTLYVFNLTNGDEQEVPIEHPSALLSPDGEQVAQYSEDNNGILLTSLDGGKTQTLTVPAGLVPLRPQLRLRFSPEGSRLAAAGLQTGDEQGVVLIYDL